MSELFDERFESLRIETPDVELHLRRGGDGPPLLLLHGYPQTHAMWHRVAPALAERFHLVMPDLRGYGDSGKPSPGEDCEAYSKRAMAADCVALMARLGFDRFHVAGHDRGARVTHRLALDHSGAVLKACVMDIAPTYHMFAATDQVFATAYYHWFFLIQPDGLPEHMIGLDPEWYLGEKLKRWSAPAARFDPAAVAEYKRCFANPETIHATCNDYRAAAGIDLEHDEVDLDRQIECPLLVLWGDQGFVHRNYDVLGVWTERAPQATGRALHCGHFLPEEAPEPLVKLLSAFFR